MRPALLMDRVDAPMRLHSAVHQIPHLLVLRHVGLDDGFIGPGKFFGECLKALEENTQEHRRSKLRLTGYGPPERPRMLSSLPGGVRHSKRESSAMPSLVYPRTKSRPSEVTPARALSRKIGG
jgi:hypothetical protein